jgi:hypothetical protein
MRIRTVIRQTGKTTTGIEIPPEVLDALGGGRRPAVRVAINGYSYRTTLGVNDHLYLPGL